MVTKLHPKPELDNYGRIATGCACCRGPNGLYYPSPKLIKLLDGKLWESSPTTSNPTFNHTEQPPTSLITMVIIYIIEFIDKNINPNWDKIVTNYCIDNSNIAANIEENCANAPQTNEELL